MVGLADGVLGEEPAQPFHIPVLAALLLQLLDLRPLLPDKPPGGVLAHHEPLDFLALLPNGIEADLERLARAGYLRVEQMQGRVGVHGAVLEQGAGHEQDAARAVAHGLAERVQRLVRPRAPSPDLVALVHHDLIEFLFEKGGEVVGEDVPVDDREAISDGHRRNAPLADVGGIARLPQADLIAPVVLQMRRADDQHLLTVDAFAGADGDKGLTQPHAVSNNARTSHAGRPADRLYLMAQCPRAAVIRPNCCRRHLRQPLRQQRHLRADVLARREQMRQIVEQDRRWGHLGLVLKDETSFLGVVNHNALRGRTRIATRCSTEASAPQSIHSIYPFLHGCMSSVPYRQIGQSGRFLKPLPVSAISCPPPPLMSLPR